MRWLVLLLIAIVATLVGINLGWRFVFAPLLALALLRWSIASLRVLVTDAKDLQKEPDGPAPVGGDERTLFWCEECGTEVLLLVRGSSRAPSHCGQRMNERTELLNN
ncbi:MAG: hypothetical protein JJT89_12180 [Nitriliruptoraceae bacterium]|nr:hypothetical protein [Nitriliruptoraceae bacterium]